MARRSQKLFDYLVMISDNLKQFSRMFADELSQLSDPAKIMERAQTFELAGDRLTQDLSTVLDGTYITPMNREDFLQLALKMDDVADSLEACAVRLDLFSISQATTEMVQFAQIIEDGIEQICASMDKLSMSDMGGIRIHTARLNQLEKDGDALLRSALKGLFSGAFDALAVMKYKEIYEIMERVTDHCEGVGDLLNAVIVKYS